MTVYAVALLPPFDPSVPTILFIVATILSHPTHFRVRSIVVYVFPACAWLAFRDGSSAVFLLLSAVFDDVLEPTIFWFALYLKFVRATQTFYPTTCPSTCLLAVLQMHCIARVPLVFCSSPLGGHPTYQIKSPFASLGNCHFSAMLSEVEGERHAVRSCLLETIWTPFFSFSVRSDTTTLYGTSSV